MSSYVATHSLFSLTYVSSATALFSAPELLDLLQTCRRNNTACGVTGILLYKEGNFMQALEGEADTVRRVHAKILCDHRHEGWITLLEGAIPHREFNNWSMGFYNLSDPSICKTPGYNEFLNVPLLSTDFVQNPSRAKKLLSTFKQRM